MSKREDSSGLDGRGGRWCRLRRGAHLARRARAGAFLACLGFALACGAEADRQVPVEKAPPPVPLPRVAPPEPGIGPRNPPRVVWSVPLGEVIVARPTLAAGPQGALTVYVGTLHGRFVGVSAEGETAGTVVVDRWLDGMVWSAAATDGVRLYVGADDDVLYAVDAMTGSISWQRRLGRCEPPRSPGPVGTQCDVDGGPVLAPDGDLYVGADGLYRIGRDGAIRWHAGQAHVFSRPLWTPQGTVVFGAHDGWVTAVSQQDGAVVWRYPVGPDVDGSAAVDADGTIFIGADDGRVYAIDAEGRLQWTFATAADLRSEIVRDAEGGLLFGSFDHRLYRLDPRTGDLSWMLQAGGAFGASAALDATGMIFVGSRDRHLYAIGSGGIVAWRMSFPAEIDSTVAIGPDGTLYLGADDGVLRALR